MLLSEYIKKQSDDTQYEYVGTIWGDEGFTFTKSELLNMFVELPDFDAELDDTNPVYGHREYDDEGEMIGKYYLLSDTIRYYGRLIDEAVLELEYAKS